MGTVDRTKQPGSLVGRSPEEIYDAVPSGLLVLDGDGLIQSANASSLSLLGYERDELVGRPVYEVFPSDGSFSMSQLERLMPDRPPLRTRGSLRARNGSMIPVLIGALALLNDDEELDGAVVSFLEIPQRSITSDELSHAHQLESVGKVTAGIAHEINTPVQFIGDSMTFLDSAFTDLSQLLSKYKEMRDAAEAGFVSTALIADVKTTEEEIDLEFLEEEIPKSIKRTLDGAYRVGEMTRAVKEFTYPDQNEKVAVDLNAALQNALIIARNEYKYVADLETDLGDLPPVFCLIGHLNQVFLNIVVNAANAIAAPCNEDSRKGKILIQTRSEGDNVLISISDTGCGIPEEIRDRIFDAFFTTKAAGKGTGQGLAIARSIVVDKHFGTLDMDTQVGHGTTFFIRLPVDGRTPVDPGRQR